MLLEEGGVVERGSYIHPRAEPEIAFVLRKRLEGKVSLFEALDAVDGIAPAIELIDSRFRDFKFRLADVVADNASSAGFLLGGWHPRSLDIGNLGMIIESNGEPVEIGSSAAILGSPLRSLVAAARLAAQVGTALEAGDIVLAGAATAAIPLTPGAHIRGVFEHLGTISFTVQ
jgi:2-oxo-3-hexenedioate decarboxylase